MRTTIVALALALAGCVLPAGADSPRTDLVIAVGTTGRLASTADAGRRRAPWIEYAADRERFVELWERYVPGDPEEAAKRVDFDRDLAVFLLLGPQPTGGYAIEPFDVEVDGRVIRVHAKLVQPMKPDDFTTQAITAPYAVVRAPAVSFDRVEWSDLGGRLVATRVPE